MALFTKCSMASKDTCLIHSSLILGVTFANEWLLSSLLFLGCECGRDDGRYLLRLGSAPPNIFEVKYMFLPSLIIFTVTSFRLMGSMFFWCCNDDDKTSFLILRPDENTTHLSHHLRPIAFTNSSLEYLLIILFARF